MSLRTSLFREVSDLPSSTAGKMVAKLSSTRIISAASLATSVPPLPIEMPMSASLRAGASLTPSPLKTDQSQLKTTREHSRHGYDLASALESFYYCHLMPWRSSCKNADAFYAISQLSLTECVDLSSGHHSTRESRGRRD